MSDYTTLIKKHNYYDVSRYSESSGNSSSELDIISDISFSDHELQLKEVVISSEFEFNEDFNNNYDDGESDSEDSEGSEDSNDDGHTSVDELSDLDQNHSEPEPSFKMRSFVCSVKGCSKKFMMKGGLQRHIRYNHRKERKSFICFDPQCQSMKFSTHDLLKRHQRNVHENKTLYVCKEKERDKRYDTVDHLRSHGAIKKYTRENRTQKQHISINRVRGQIYRCSKPGCNMSFYDLFSYANHLRVHPDGETQKIYHCNEPGCDRFFTNLYDLWNHTRFGHSKGTIERSHKCDESGCIRSFDTLYGLWVHRRSHIRENTELEKNLMNSEIKIYARKYPCKIPGCSRVFDSKSAVASHKRFHRTGKDENEDHEIEGTYNCDVRGCDKVFESLLELWDHGRLHLENDRKVCDEPEYSLTNDKLGEVNCDIQGCSFKTEQFETLKRHLEDDHNMKSYHVCDKEGCNFCCTDQSNLHIHQQIHIVAKENFFKCDEPGCDKVYKRLCHLRYHQNSNGHRILLTNQQQNHEDNHDYYTCDEPGCGKAYKRLCHLRHHQNRRGHLILLTNQQQNHPEVVENYHACDEPGCDKIYNRVCHLRAHQRAHRNRRKHQTSMILTQNHPEVVENYHACDEPGCDKIYKRVCHLRAHQRAHRNRRKHQTSMILTNQQQQNHSKFVENYHACDEPGCDKIYNRVCHLRAHQRVHKNRRKHQTSMILTQNHSDVDENYHTCDEPGCDKIYKRVCHLRTHQRAHKNRRKHQTSMILTQNHSDVDENFHACDEPGCDKIYKRVCHLRAHQRAHRNRRKHQTSMILTNQQKNHFEVDGNYLACDEPGCGKVFKRICHFTKHKNYNHVKLLLPSVHIENVNLDFNKESTYWCDHPGCFFITKQVENLARHKTIHTGEPRFSCDIAGCNYECGQKIQLINHQLSCLNKKISKQPKKKRKYVCDQEGCEERFYMLVTLKKHKREDHSMRDKVYASDKTITKGAYNLRNNDQTSYEDEEDLTGKPTLVKPKPKLKIHNNFVIRPRLSQHACNYQGCNRRFITLTWLKKHKVKDHPKNTDQNFTLNPQLENHSMQISQIPTVSRKRSGDKLEDESNIYPYGLRKRQRINKINTLIDDDDECICKFTGCRKIFNSVPSLKAHQRKFHMITKTYSCNRAGCNFRTKFFEKLEKHQTEKHRMLL